MNNTKLAINVLTTFMVVNLFSTPSKILASDYEQYYSDIEVELDIENKSIEIEELNTSGGIIEIVFNQYMDISSINETSIYLMIEGENTEIKVEPLEVEYKEYGKSMSKKFILTTNEAKLDKEYTLIIKDTVKNHEGTKLDVDIVQTFKLGYIPQSIDIKGEYIVNRQSFIEIIVKTDKIPEVEKFKVKTHAQNEDIVEIEEKLVNFNENGEAIIILKGLSQGNSKIIISVDGTTIEKEINVIVEDIQAQIVNAAPTINSSDKIISIDGNFDPFEGMSAIDIEDGDLTDKLIISENTVNNKQVGVYHVLYTVTDSQGATSTKKINIEVKERINDIQNDSTQEDSIITNDNTQEGNNINKDDSYNQSHIDTEKVSSNSNLKEEIDKDNDSKSLDNSKLDDNLVMMAITGSTMFGILLFLGNLK